MFNPRMISGRSGLCVAHLRRIEPTLPGVASVSARHERVRICGCRCFCVYRFRIVFEAAGRGEGETARLKVDIVAPGVGIRETPPRGSPPPQVRDAAQRPLSAPATSRPPSGGRPRSGSPATCSTRNWSAG